jgi:dolichyl-phosphate beta-glucosyltransferase
LNWAFYPYKNWKRNKRDSANEKILITTGNDCIEFTKYQQQMRDTKKKLEYSLVIPAYNEEKRLPHMLTQTLDYFTTHNYTYEIIVINDASKDKTTETALKFTTYKGKPIDLKVIDYEFNKGKGGAVRIGMLTAIGEYVLMLDADGATEIKEFERITKMLKEKVEENGLGIVAGSRNHLQQEAIAQRKWYRNILMHLANFIVNTICGVKLKDTQCGFKLFTKASVPQLFFPMHIERWAFDVELFIIANEQNIPYAELPVNWRDVEGSHLSVVDASTTMARDFIMMRVFYLMGLWSKNDVYKLPGM